MKATGPGSGQCELLEDEGSSKCYLCIMPHIPWGVRGADTQEVCLAGVIACQEGAKSRAGRQEGGAQLDSGDMGPGPSKCYYRMVPQEVEEVQEGVQTTLESWSPRSCLWEGLGRFTAGRGGGQDF